MHAIRILSEAVWRLYWEAFESWTAERDNTKWQGAIEDVLKTQLDSNVDVSEQLASIQTCQLQLVFLQEQLLEFQNSLADLPTAVFWSNFIDSCTTSEKVIGWDICASHRECYPTSQQLATTSMVNSIFLYICLR